MKRIPLIIYLAAAVAVAASASGSETVESARSLFLNLAGTAYIQELDVAAPPPGLEAPWAAKVTWERVAGFPPWGNLSLAFRAGTVSGYSFDLFVENATGSCSLNVYLTESDGDRWVEAWDLTSRVGKGWLHVDLKGDSLRQWAFGNGEREASTIRSITFEPSGEDAGAVFWIANLAIHTDAGTRGILSLLADSDCPPPTATPSIVRLPFEPRCYMGMSLDFFAKPQGQEFVAKTRELIGNLGVAALASSWQPEWREPIEAARRDGLDVRVQNGGISGMAGLITRAQAWGTDPQGRSRNTTPGFGDGMHGVSYTHPAAREAVRRVMAGMRGLGVLDYEQVDYVWPWMGGPWGYGEWDILAFRTNLQELDEGLRLAGNQRIHFWDYVAAYGTARLTAESLGLDTWDSFTPVDPGNTPPDTRARNHFIFVALTHYEWLKFAQAMGVESRSWGGGFLATMNPEDVSNGGDYLYWNLLADTGTAYFERFGNPGATEQWRHDLPYLRQEATRAGKRLGVIYEVGVGGHGTPYLDAEVAYCLSYDCTASGQFDDCQNEWMGEADWTASQEGYHRDRLDNWLATARGFNQAKEDGAALPPRKVLAVGLRCVMHAVGSSPSYLLTRGALNDLNVEIDYADLTMDPQDWERYQVIVYTPWESSRRHLEALRRWLDADSGRVLITHGAVPTRIATGMGYAPSAAIGDPELGRLLGLGAISAAGPANGAIGVVASEFADVFTPGKSLAFPGDLYSTEQGEALVTLGGKPLVTRLKQASGSVVYYLNYAAGQPETRATDGAVIERILATAECEPSARSTEGVYCHTFDCGVGKVAVLWSRDACNRFDFEYRSDKEQRMRYHDPLVDLEVRLAAPDGTYRVYDPIEKTDEVRTVSGNGLLVNLKGRSCALVYYGPDTPQWLGKIQGLKQAPPPWRHAN